MEIDETKDGEVTILAPKGSLNTQTSPKLEQQLLAVLGAKGRLVVIDFKGVDYLSSAALRVLLMFTRRLARADGRLLLCAMSADLKKVFAISGFDRDFTIVTTRGEAVGMAAATPARRPAEPEAKAATGKTTKKAAAPAGAEAPRPAPAAPGGWPFLAKPQAAERPAAGPPAPAAPVAPPPGPLAATVARILATGEEAAPWASWPELPTTKDRLETVAALLASER